MNPFLSLSAAEAPNRPAPVTSIAAVAAMRIFLMDFSVLLTGGRSPPMRGAPSRALRACYRSGTNTVPSAAGAVEPPVRAREIRTRTKKGAREGKADIDWHGR